MRGADQPTDAELDLRLYLVTDPRYRFEPWLPALFDAGVTMIQVRDKSAPDAELARQVERVLELAAPFRVRVVVNDRVAVARSAGAHGVHLGRADESPVRARGALGPSATIGLSLETVDEVAPDEVSYAAVSPVFATPSKDDAAPALGLDGVRTLRARNRTRLVGIGGIDAARAEAVVAAGADGVAVISAILAADDPAGAARRLRDAVDRALSTRSDST